jgi:xanthine dehydrogenase YagS FAD-binding subunit
MMHRDMMPHFELYQPGTVEDAVELAQRFGTGAWFLAGGNDSLDWFKDRNKRPAAVIEIAGIQSLYGIREIVDGIEIGALTKLVDIEHSELIREKYALLASAAGRVASPQIRNSGTIGGNLCQDARCWYYRFGVSCYRAGGNTCYADTPQGMNREHCLFGASRCVAVSPSDTATACVALDAQMVIQGPFGVRIVPAAEFFVAPGLDITRMTVLKPDELLTAVRLPRAWAGANFYFEKVADRNTWDFALVSIARAMILDGGLIRQIRLVAGAVACVPHRLHASEQQVLGKTPGDAAADVAAQVAAQGATALTFNGFKVPLLENLVRRALRPSL